jgi:hypothetical protein
VIPEALGGRLSFSCLCKECNERIGRLEATLALDPTIRDAIEKLAERMDSLADSRSKAGRRYIGKTDEQTLDFRLLPSGEYRLIEKRAPDGTGYKNTDDARDEIRGRLAKRGTSTAEIESVLESFDRGEPVTVDELTFVPRTGDFDVGLPYDEELASGVVFLASAYIFLAGLCENQIYSAAFERVRTTLQEGEDAGGWEATRLGLGKSGHHPFHRIWVSEIGPPVEIVVTLFGWDSWQVRLEGAALKTRPPRYILDLETNEEHFID